MHIKIIKFGTEHCPQCKMQDRELIKITSVPVERIDAEDSKELTSKYNIMSIPTTLIVNYDDGKELVRYSGLVKYDDLEKALKSFI